MEYVVKKNETEYVVLTGNKTSFGSHASASVFKVKERAEKIAKKTGCYVEPFYGKVRMGNKDFVSPKKNPINRSKPYRTV